MSHLQFQLEIALQFLQGRTVTIIKNHVATSKHENSKVAKANKQINDRTIETDVHARGENSESVVYIKCTY